jgi:hypothetical protein
VEKIRELMEKGFSVQDRENGQMRPVRYSDIVIFIKRGKRLGRNFRRRTDFRRSSLLY